jgi:pimeloyl-ACP methyl ester carboxylesterase
MSLDVPIDTGEGPVVVVLHGFAMRPDTYEGLVRLLAARCRVVVPDLFAVRGRWTYSLVLDALVAALEERKVDQMTMIAHSFGGGLELGYASRYPERLTELVFSDTLGASREWRLADEALRHPERWLALATPEAMSAFFRNVFAHPRQLIDAAWWGFSSDREYDSETVARARIPAHVLWANRDSILSRDDGRRFAGELNASFTVAKGDDGRPIDHDWMFEQPATFFEHLQGLGLKALSD